MEYLRTVVTAVRCLLEYARKHLPVKNHTDLRVTSTTSYRTAPLRVAEESIPQSSSVLRCAALL